MDSITESIYYSLLGLLSTSLFHVQVVQLLSKLSHTPEALQLGWV